MLDNNEKANRAVRLQYMRYARLRDDPTNPPKGISRESINRAWGFASKYKKSLVAYIGVIGLSSIVGLAPPLVLKALLDSAIPKKSLGLLYFLVALAFILNVAQTAFGVISRWIGSRIGEGLINDLRVALFVHLQKLPIAFYTKSQTGAILSRINNDVLGAQQSVSTASSAFSDVLTLVLTLGVMIKLSLPVTLIALALIPLLIVVDRTLGTRIAPLARQQMIANAEMSTFATERVNVSGALLVKLFGNPEREASRYRVQAGGVRDAGIRLALGGRIYYGALALIGGLGSVVVYLIGGRLAIKGSLSFGTLVALSQYASRLYNPITDLASSRVNLAQALVSFDRVAEVLSIEPTVTDPGTPVPLGQVKGRIEFKDVNFAYPSVDTPFAQGDQSIQDEGAEVLHDVNFVVPAGTMTALVGHSGAGKSTIAALISRLYDPDSGRITIDGIDIRDVTLSDLGSHIGVVSQDPHLFHDSIAANLRYARPEATLPELVEATRAAQIYSTIMELPEGFETIVGERGYRLSGGERQRLAIARVFLKRPRLVVLDEATSHLDTENEAAVQEALAHLLSERTSIVIAHRLSTILAADQILVVKDGTIAESGTHATLLAQGGVYRDLFDAQVFVRNAGE